MGTVVQRISGDGLVSGSGARGTARQEVAIERGFRLRGPVEEKWGRSESLDPDNVGDIADEAAGHRG